MADLGGLYRPTPQGYNGNRAGCWARLSASPASGFSADYLGRQAAPAAGGSGWWLITVVMTLMTQAWSGERGYSPAAWWEITVATPCLIWLMVHGPQGRNGPPAGSRPPSGPTGQASAIFRALAAW